MAFIPMYLLEPDIAFLNDWLNAEPEIAFLVTDGPGRWIAKKQHAVLPDVGTQLMDNIFHVGQRVLIPFSADYQLWHLPSGPLPLLEAVEFGLPLKFGKEEREHDPIIPDPWLGWTEKRRGAHSWMPYFGPGHPGVIEWQIRLPKDARIPLSTFGWIGNHYKRIGLEAQPSTKLFWSRLRRFIKQAAKQIPRGNRPEREKEVFTFPAAWREIQNGRPCSVA